MFRFGDPGGRVYGAVGTSNANLLAYWTLVNATNATWSISAGNGRTSGSCIRLTSTTTANSNYITKTLDSRATWGAAFAFKTSLLPNASSIPIVALFDALSNQVDLRLLSDGTLQFTRNATAIGSVSSIALNANTWYHIEIKVTIHPSAGSIECRVNGVAVIGPTSSLNTRNTANSTANQFAIGNTSSNTTSTATTWDWDDIIVWDTQTTDAAGNTDVSDFIGDCSIAWLLPTAAGNSTQYTPDSGSNYARVADTTIDTTSYVESSTVNQIDSYTMADLPAGATSVKTAAIVSYTRKTDTGSRGVKNLVRTGSTNYLQATEIALSDSYLYSFQNWGSNPNTTSAWTPSDINGLEVGQKVTT